MVDTPGLQPERRACQRAGGVICQRLREAIARPLVGGARPENLVLPGPEGSNGIPRGARAPLSTANWRRVYKAAVEAAGAELAHLDLRGPHDLRHTCAALLIAQGAHPKAIEASWA